MQEVNEEYYNSEEFLLSEVKVRQAEMQYKGFMFASKMLCHLFQSVTGMSVEEATNLNEKDFGEIQKGVTPEKTLFHIVSLLREISEQGESLGRLLIKEWLH